MRNFGLNNLHSLLAFSSVCHNLLEDDGRVVRGQGERMNAVGSARELYFYHLVDDAGGYRRVVDVVDVLWLLIHVGIEIYLYWGCANLKQKCHLHQN